nr:retrotransposon protein, putative, unclassified [Tanacetum cinerariifolium]
MEYTYNNKKVVLRGTKQATIQWMQGKQRQGKKLVSAELSAMSLPPKRTPDHMIPLVPNTPPVNNRPYKHPPTQKDAIELMDDTWRMCVDYRQLNKATVKDKFPIPIVEELIDELSGSKFFSKLDLRYGYHQIRMEEGDVYKTAFRTHEGHYEFLVMPFGLTNAPSTFQSLMNSVFKEFLRKFVLVFFDDILIYSKSLESHLDHLRQVLTVMETNSLFAKRSKCAFTATSVEYLGHIISRNGVPTDHSKVQAMKDWPVPKNIKQLRGFLGLTGYYRKFIKDYAVKSRPLTELLKKNAFQWSQGAQTTFEGLKVAMIQEPVLALPDFNKTFTIETNASGVGIGEVLKQEGHPIAFLSKTLAPKHHALSTYEKEFLALQSQTYKKDKYALVDGILRRKGKIVMVKQVVRECDVCQREKPDLSAYLGLLQPFPIFEKIWSSISMDFIEKLPNSHGKTVILVVVDRLSKYAHFIALQHPFTASTGAQVFLDNVYRLHGMPDSIVCNKDNIFLSHFWQSLFKVLKTLWLPMAEFWYNTNFHSAINTKSFQTVYGQTPPLHTPCVNGFSLVESVDRTMKAREELLGSSHKIRILAYCDPNGVLSAELMAILDRRLAKVGNRAVPYILIKWSNDSKEDATWENYANLIQ